MDGPFGRMHLIVNPRAGHRSVDRGWPGVKRVIEDGGLSYDVTFTERAGHAREAARAALDAGCRYIVAVGGDGTVHEVVNGMMDIDGPVDPDAVLGLVPSGSGCDFVKTFGIPHDAADAARHLLGDGMWGRIDIGRVRYRDAGGGEATRWFANIAEAGVGANVVVAASKMPRWLGGRTYRLAALKGVATYRPGNVRVAMHGRTARGGKTETPFADLEQRGTVSMVVVANGQFFGGGLRVAPRALPSDAMLDVLIGHGSTWDAVKGLRRMPTGSHVPDPKISEYLADRVTIEGDTLAVEADGEPLGTTPATFDLVPEALRLKI